MRLVVLGWDSATFDVIDPLVADGKLRALAGIAERGFRAPLRSTWPPMTDCAWTSAFTGVNPGAHGIFGSWYRAPGAYACRYFSSRDRRAPALWEVAEEPRFLVWNVPMTFPPTPVNGAMVAGYGAPPGAQFCDPPELQRSLASRWNLDDLLDRAPHRSLEQFLDDLLRGLECQAEALPWAAREAGADCVVAVWPHVDRAQHFFWRYRGTDHALATAVERVYEAMDRATSAVIEAFPEADVMVVSDHGAGELKGDVNLGSWLVDNGHATYGDGKRPRYVQAAWALPPAVRKLGRRLAPGMARRLLGATLAGQLAPFEWARTRAFVGFHSDLWLNQKGREPAGIVPADSVPELLDELGEQLLALTNPSTGEPLFAGAHRRADIYSGPASGLAPDLMLDSWSAGYRVAPSRQATDGIVGDPEPLPGVDAAWSSDHRPVGVFFAGGPRIARGTSDELSLYDLCPTALALFGAAVPDGLDGRVATEVIEPRFLSEHEVRSSAKVAERRAGGDYSEEEAAAVAAHLKNLGYIE